MLSPLAFRENWWTWSGSNRRPLPCHGSALPAAPQAHVRGHYGCLADYSFILADWAELVNESSCARRTAEGGCPHILSYITFSALHILILPFLSTGGFCHN